MLEDMNNHDVRKYLPWMREQLFARLFLHSHIEEETVDVFEERISLRLFLDASSFVAESPQGVPADSSVVLLKGHREQNGTTVLFAVGYRCEHGRKGGRRV